MRPATPKPRLRVKSGVIFHKIAAKSVLCGAVKYKTELANHVLTVGLFAVKSIDGAKHVAPAVADRRTGVQLPPPPPIEEGELISVHLFYASAPRYRPYVARVYGLRTILNLRLSETNIL